MISRLKAAALILLTLVAVSPATAADDAGSGVIRKAGARWIFADGDRLYWFGSSHTSIGLYASCVEFYIHTRFPEMKLVSLHGSRPPSLTAAAVKGVIAERKPTVMLPEGGFYDSSNPDEFVRCAASVAEACTNAGVKCIFIPTTWLANSTGRLNTAFLEAGADFKEVEKRLRGEGKLPYGDMMVPAEITGCYYRPAKGLAIDRTMAALKAWGDRNNITVLETYGDQAEWARARWKKDPGFVLLEGTTPHHRQSGYIAAGIYMLERLEAPVLESRAEIQLKDNVPAAGPCINCDIMDITGSSNGVKFLRRDKVLPVIPPVPAASLPEDVPELLRQSPYFICISGLAPGSYNISVNGCQIGRCSSGELSEGVNINEVHLRNGMSSIQKLPWTGLWKACRENTMDKPYVPAAGQKTGEDYWAWSVSAVATGEKAAPPAN